MRLPKDFGFWCLLIGGSVVFVSIPILISVTLPGPCIWSADDPIKRGRIGTENAGLFSSGVTAYYVIRPGHRKNGDECEARIRVTESEYERLIYGHEEAPQTAGQSRAKTSTQETARS